MRKRLAFSMAFLAAAIIAPAAGAQPVSSWQGSYVGLSAGGHFGTVGFNFPATGESGTVHPSGFTGGVFRGHLWQSDRWIFGTELGFRAISAAKSGTTPSGITFRQNTNWVADWRGIVGHSYGDWMAYVFGGLAYGSLTHRATNAGGAWSNTETRTGWTAGLGAQKRITDKIALRLDYAYVDLGTAMCVIAPPPAPPLPPMPNVSHQSHDITGGIVFNF